MVAKKEVEYHYYSTICPLHSKTNYLLLTQCKFESPSFYPGHFQVLMAPTDQRHDPGKTNFNCNHVGLAGEENKAAGRFFGCFVDVE